MRKYLSILLILITPFAFGASSSVNFGVVGQLGAYQGTSSSNTGLAMTFTGLGTTSNLSYTWWRSGDRLYVTGAVQAGTLQGSALSVVLPAGYEIDFTKTVANRQNLGIGTGLWSATQFFTSGGWVLNAFSDGSSASSIFFSFKGDGTTSYAKANGNDILSGLGYFSFSFNVPIKGWEAGGAGSAGNFYNGYQASISGGCTSSGSTFADPSACTGIALTQVNASGITCVTAASSLPGITCTLLSTGMYEVSATVQFEDQSNSVIYYSRIVESSGTVVSPGVAQTPANTFNAQVVNQGTYNAASTSVTFKLQGAVSGASASIRVPAVTGGAAINWMVRKL